MNYEHHSIYEHAATALARMETPDFSAFDEDSVFDAFNTILLRGYTEWLAYFQSLISTASNGQASLVEKPFYTGIRGLNSTFLLTNGNNHTNVIIATGIPPIILQKSEEQ
jgi:hypothetical protein